MGNQARVGPIISPDDEHEKFEHQSSLLPGLSRRIIGGFFFSFTTFPPKGLDHSKPYTDNQATNGGKGGKNFTFMANYAKRDPSTTTKEGKDNRTILKLKIIIFYDPRCAERYFSFSLRAIWCLSYASGWCFLFFCTVMRIVPWMKTC